MAHSPMKKAQAQALLLTGEAPQRVADTLKLPYSTIKRWQQEVFAEMRGIIGPLDFGLFDFSPRNVASKTDTKKK